jgi:hypothetical protein
LFAPINHEHYEQQITSNNKAQFEAVTGHTIFVRSSLTTAGTEHQFFKQPGSQTGADVIVLDLRHPV